MLTDFRRPLEVCERPSPVARPTDALVRVRAVGLCATDVKLHSGALGAAVSVPRILGHEIAGEVVDPGSTDLAEGQRVACHHAVVCGVCSACRGGRPQFCREQRLLGRDLDGGLAELIAVPAVNALPFDERTRFAAAAVAMCAAATCWHALHGRGDARPGESILIVGAGGLGLQAIQIARDLGMRVAVLEPDATRLRVASTVGAELATTPDDAGQLDDWAGEGVDLALELSGTRSGFTSAAERVRQGGRVVCCGYQPGRDFAIESLALVGRELTVVGSRGSSRQDAQAALRAVDDGRIDPVVGAVFQLADVNAALEAVAAGRAAGRVVIQV